MLFSGLHNLSAMHRFTNKNFLRVKSVTGRVSFSREEMKASEGEKQLFEPKLPALDSR
jgi:hypothetical protein